MEEAVLIVDDEPIMVRALRGVLGREFDTVDSAGTAEEGLERLSEGSFDLVLLDLHMPGMGGLEGLRLIKEHHPDTEVIVITGQGTIDDAVECMKRGAFDLLTKPFDSLDLVVLAARRAVERRSLRSRNQRLTARLRAKDARDSVVAVSAQMRSLLDTAEALGQRDASVLITGESGTGKELIARLIHESSPRCDEEFVAVNCGALPATVIESELFGHARGAFTGAVQENPGLFKRAHRGTLFLDEVGELPQPLQVKLLRALEEGEIRPVGATVSTRVDVRVVAATNRDLQTDVAEGRFRDDLYYRLAVVPVTVPPLRARPDDIPALVRHFVAELNEQHPKFDSIHPEALDRLASYDWPGNVRQLRNAIERAFALGSGDQLRPEHLPQDLAGTTATHEATEVPLSLAAYERLCLERALREAGGDPSRAAQLLGVSRATFYRKIRNAGLDPARFRSTAE